MTAPTFSFAVTGATHDDVMAEANRVAKAYWGRHAFDVVEVQSYRYSDGERTTQVTTKQHMVAGGRLPQPVDRPPPADPSLWIKR